MLNIYLIIALFCCSLLLLLKLSYYNTSYSNSNSSSSSFQMIMFCPQAEDTLEEFLKQKSVDSSAILQADKNLTEKEKKIMGESVLHPG